MATEGKQTETAKLQAAIDRISAKIVPDLNIVYEYCFIAVQSSPLQKEGESDGFLYFFADDEKIEIPYRKTIRIIAELGKTGWEMVGTRDDTKLQYPIREIRPGEREYVAAQLGLGTMQSVYEYEESTISYRFYFKRQSSVTK